jgi:hypothetical protein
MLDLRHANASGYAKMAKVWFDGLTSYLPICASAGPYFKSEAVTEAQVGNEYRYVPVILANPDSRFTALTAPAGMRVHPDTGEIRWTPDGVVQYNVDLQVQNSAGSAVQSFILNVL